MISDRLVVDIRDESLSKRLQMESDLTLEKAKKLIRQSEAVQQQQGILKSSNEILKSIAKSKANSSSKESPRTVTGRPIPRQKCRRCRKTSHSRQSCPAKDATCFRCNRKGHFGAQRLSKTVAESTIAESSHEDLYSDTIQ